MKDNHGQVLVFFILLLPLLALLLAFVIDYGILISEQEKIKNTVKETITYALTSTEDETIIKQNTQQLLTRNINNIQNYTITWGEHEVVITVSKKQPSLFGLLFKQANYQIDCSYQGNIQDNHIEIKKR